MNRNGELYLSVGCKLEGPFLMEVEPHISFEGMAPSDAVRVRIENEIEKLERYFGRITACRVMVIKPQKRRHHGDLYEISVHLTLPGGKEIHADRNPPLDHAHEDIYVAIRDVFKAARRMLQDEARILRGAVKQHEGPAIGKIGTIVAEEDYGFIETTDGREIYFHRNSVANDGFGKLAAGTPVTFSEARGEKGPQATFVKPL